MNSTNTRRRGFSLVELVVCVAIIATVAGVGAARFSRSAERARVESAARRVVSVLEDARTRARTQGIRCKVAINVDTGLLEFKGTAASNAELDVVNLGADPYRVQVISSNFNGEPDVEFNPWGRPVAGGTMLLRSGAFQRAVGVAAETGHASLQ